MMQLIDKIQAYLRGVDSLGIAFSGGTDSALLAFMAQELLGDKAYSFTIQTPYMAQAELSAALSFARKHSLNHELIQLDMPTRILHNPPERCYLCKQVLFQSLLDRCKQYGLSTLADGSNADDLNDYRPGMRALQELKIHSPFLHLGITKQEIRSLSKHFQLDTWNTPSTPCLLTRLPYNDTVTAEKLWQIEQAESFLHHKGFTEVRVRHEKHTARIELPKHMAPQLLSTPINEEVLAFFTAIGFTFVSLDLKGFQSGNMNKQIGK